MIINIMLGIVIGPIVTIIMLVMITDVTFARRHPANRRGHGR